MTPHDYAIYFVAFVIAMGVYLVVSMLVGRHEDMREIVMEKSMMDEYRILDSYKGPTCSLSHKVCRNMDCRQCVFALAEKLKEMR